VTGLFLIVTPTANAAAISVVHCAFSCGVLASVLCVNNTLLLADCVCACACVCVLS
jgi:hypothetical protein